MPFSEVQKKNGGNFGHAHFGFLLRPEIRYFIVKEMGQYILLLYKII